MTSLTNSRIYWEATCSPPSFPPLSQDLEVDVAIVGGGIVGISAARMLKDAGMTVAVDASSKPKSFDDLAPGDAAILSIDGENVAAYRDCDGRIHAVSAVCTHMGCVLGWNATDETWDCPCHGSRFALDGEVIAGPAVAPLKAKSPG